MIQYIFDKEWRRKVDRQIELEKLIIRHIGNPYYTFVYVMVGIVMGLMFMLPVDLLKHDMDISLWVIYVIPNAIVVYLYNKTLLEVVENGSKVNIFTKYVNVPVEKKIVMSAKMNLMIKRCLLYTVLYQGINLCVRLVMYMVRGNVYWGVWNLYPAIIFLVACFFACIRIRILASKK